MMMNTMTATQMTIAGYVSVLMIFAFIFSGFIVIFSVVFKAFFQCAGLFARA